MTTVLITGTTGLIGGHLARNLHGAYDVIALDRSQPAFPENFVKWNFRDELPAEMPVAVDIIIHAAATDGRDSTEPDRDCFEVNTRTTARLLQYAARAGVKQFVYFSTGSVYPLGHTPCLETDGIVPDGHYAASKAAAESLVFGYQREMRTLVCRPFYAYGPGQRRQRLIPGLIERIQAGRQVWLNGAEGKPVINPMYVDDVVQWVRHLLAAEESGVINLAGPEAISIRSLAVRIAERLELPVSFEVGPELDGNRLGAIERVCDVTGYRPRYDVCAGLERLLDSKESPALPNVQ